MKTLYKKPSVKLIGKMDHLEDAWRISRPHVDMNTVDRGMLETLDLPVSQFINYTFEVDSSLLFRDLLFTLRPIGVWARSYRSVPITPESTRLSGEYEGIETEWHQSQMAKVYQAIEQGIPQDYAKVNLPMSANTTFAINVDDRTLLNFINTLKLHCPDLYNIYGVAFLEAIGKDDEYLNKRVMNDIYSKLAISKAEFLDTDKGTKQLGDFVYGVHKVQGNLMAQFLRQHYSTVKNELWNIVSEGFTSYTVQRLTCSSELVVAMYANYENLKKIIQNRSCAFAQWDKSDNSSWASIIGDYVEHMEPEEFLGNLTCKGKCENCTISQDMAPKLMAGKTIDINKDYKLSGEVNPICPIFIERPDRVTFRESLFNSDSKIARKWHECLDKGLLPNNPNNPNRLEYEDNVKTHGHLGFKPTIIEEPIYGEMDYEDYLKLMDKLGMY